MRGVHEIADIDDVGLEQLVERLRRVAAELKRRNRPLLERGEGVGNKSLRAQLLVDLPERRLTVVEIDELYLGLDDHGVFQLLAAVHEHRELAALDVDLEEIDAVDLGNVVEALRLEPRTIDDAGVGLEEAEHLERGRAGGEQAAPAGIGAEIERVLAAVADRVGQIGLVCALLLVELGARGVLRLEAGEAAELRVEQRLVRRRPVHRIGADVDHVDQAGKLEQSRQFVGRGHGVGPECGAVAQDSR
jgi:hypothetical protein